MTGHERDIRITNLLRSHRASLFREITRTEREALDAGRNLHTQTIGAREPATVDVACSVLALKAATVKRIDEALEQLKAGEFGVCADCDEAIGYEQLAKTPFATQCTDCHDMTTPEPMQPRMRRFPLFAHAQRAM